MAPSGSSTHSRKSDKCPGCGAQLRSTRYDVGWDVVIPTKHCVQCGYNKTDEEMLASGLAKLRGRMNASVKVVAIGDGLGIRFPKEIVDHYAIRKGGKVEIRPGRKRLEIVL